METRLRHSFGLGEITVFHTKILNCCAISKKNIMELFINQNADEFWLHDISNCNFRDFNCHITMVRFHKISTSGN